MKKFGIIFLFTLSFTSCKKEGCIDANATNYDSEASEDDGSCVYADPTNVYAVAVYKSDLYYLLPGGSYDFYVKIWKNGLDVSNGTTGIDGYADIQTTVFDTPSEKCLSNYSDNNFIEVNDGDVIQTAMYNRYWTGTDWAYTSVDDSIQITISIVNDQINYTLDYSSYAEGINKTSSCSVHNFTSGELISIGFSNQ